MKIGSFLAGAAPWAALAFTVVFPSHAAAQACCTATAFGESGVVGRCQRGVLSSAWSWREYPWRFDLDGRFLGHRDRKLRDLQWMLAGGLRLPYRSVQIHGQIPILYQVRRLADDGSSHLGIGDGLIGLRWTLLQDPMLGIRSQWGTSWRPFLDLALSLKAPSGRPPWESNDFSGADVTGNGAWQAMGGVKISKFVIPRWAVTLGAFRGRSLAVPGPGGIAFRPGDESQWLASLLYIHSVLWSGGGNVTWRQTGPSTNSGIEIAGSQSRRLAFGFQVTRVLKAPSWEIDLSLSSDAPWDGGGKNIALSGPSLTMALRRALQDYRAP